MLQVSISTNRFFSACEWQTSFFQPVSDKRVFFSLWLTNAAFATRQLRCIALQRCQRCCVKCRARRSRPVSFVLEATSALFSFKCRFEGSAFVRVTWNRSREMQSILMTHRRGRLRWSAASRCLLRFTANGTRPTTCNHQQNDLCHRRVGRRPFCNNSTVVVGKGGNNCTN